MTDANINSFSVVTSIDLANVKIYTAISSASVDAGLVGTTLNSYMNHDNMTGFVANEHRAMGTGSDTLTVWSGFQINSLLGTKANSSALSTYATSASLKSLTDNHSTWINSVYTTKANSSILSTYATSSSLKSLSNNHSTWINSVYTTKQNSVNLSTYATSSSLKSLSDTNSSWINSMYTNAGTLSVSSLIISGTTGVVGILDEDNMVSDSAVNLATQQSIKKYVDDNISAGAMTSFNITGDSGTPETVTNGETIDIEGGLGINTTISSLNRVIVSTVANSINHDDLLNFNTNEHIPLGTSSDTLTVWSGFQINSLLATKANSSVLSTYATSSTLNNHINSIQIHTNHNSVFVSTSNGLSGGGDLTQTRSIYLNINGLTSITTVDPGSDKIGVYSNTNTANRGIKPHEFWGIMETTQISTTSYSLQSSDFGKHLEFNGTASQTIIIGNDADLTFPVDGVVMWTAINTNGVNFTGGTSSTVNNVQGYTKVTSLYSVGGLRKRAEQTWVNWGALDS